MERTDEQMQKRDALLSEIERTFAEAGYGTRSMRSPAVDYSAVMVYINLGNRRQRRATVTIEDNGNCSLYLSRLYVVPEGQTGDDLAEEIGESPRVHYVAGGEGVGQDLLKRLRSSITLSHPDSPDVTAEELRQTLAKVADPERNSSSFGNPRGSDIATLANVALRLLERVEALERRVGV